MDLPRLALPRASPARQWDTELPKVLAAMVEVNKAPLRNGLSLSLASRTSTMDSAVISSSRGRRGPLGLRQGLYNRAHRSQICRTSKSSFSPLLFQLFFFLSFSDFPRCCPLASSTHEYFTKHVSPRFSYFCSLLRDSRSCYREAVGCLCNLVHSILSISRPALSESALLLMQGSWCFCWHQDTYHFLHCSAQVESYLFALFSLDEVTNFCYLGKYDST
jgi:hypothetical protein